MLLVLRISLFQLVQDLCLFQAGFEPVSRQNVSPAPQVEVKWTYIDS